MQPYKVQQFRWLLPLRASGVCWESFFFGPMEMYY
jgi:hypothetical protein